MEQDRRRSQTQPRTPTETGTIPYETGLRGGAGREVENRPLGGAGILRSNGDSSQQQLQQPTGHRAVETPTFLNNTNTKSEAAWPARRVNTSPQAHIIASQGTGVGGHGQTTGTPSPGPYLPPPSTGPLSTGRPPLAGHSLPAIAAERRTLSPRLPRLTSIGQPDLRSLNPPPPQRQHFPGALPQPHPVVLPDTTVHLRPDQQSQPTRGLPMAPQHYVRAGDPGGRPPNGMTPLPSTTRSLSPPGQNQPSPSPPPLPRHRVPPQQVQAGYPPQNSYTNGTTPATNGWATGRANDYTSVYHPVGGTRLPLAEGQTALRLSTGNGIEFIVPVDTHQGSRQADEKRQRNAGASARFRKRKKEKELQERLEHQRMENQYRDLEGRIQQLAAERDRIEADRERLRNIVLHTPDISELAYQAPQSTGPDPRSGSRGGASPADTLAAAPATRGANGVNGASTNGYGAADPESGEPPSQRRRLTDPHPQVDYFATPFNTSNGNKNTNNANSASTPERLPSISANGLPGSMSHPGTPSMHPPQLPPLRLGTQTPPPATTTTTTTTTQPRAQAHQTVHRAATIGHETGWASEYDTRWMPRRTSSAEGVRRSPPQARDGEQQR
ncbi:hypothetical protein F5Y17DRAFT_448630 [Xylariaceae sp. FL0594]|nr:hypothetical protein F5Y17DRAFT_448630 [Xylariaceae sp. FL0594]